MIADAIAALNKFITAVLKHVVLLDVNFIIKFAKEKAVGAKNVVVKNAKSKDSIN